MHLAARAGVRPSIEDPLSYVQANVTATTRLLEASRMPYVQVLDYKFRQLQQTIQAHQYGLLRP